MTRPTPRTDRPAGITATLTRPAPAGDAPVSRPSATGLTTTTAALAPSQLRASGLRTSGLRAPGLAATGLAAGRGKPLPFAAGPRAGYSLGSLRANRRGLRRAARPTRHVVFLDPIDRARPAKRSGIRERYLLEYAEICNLMEWSVGDATYQVGYAEDFTWLAAAAVERELDWTGELSCEHLRDGWCLNPHSEDGHLHPLAAARYDAEEIPLDFSDLYEYRCDALYGPGITERWDQLVPLLAEARQWTLEHIDQVLATPLVGGDVALAAMRLAGFGIPDGLHRRADLEAAFRLHVVEAKDRELRNAYADHVAINLPRHLADDVPIMGHLWDELSRFEEDDAPLIDPRELQWLAFAPDQFPLADGEAGRLIGGWTATSSRYWSLFDEQFDTVRHSYPLAVAWREISMTPDVAPGG